VQDFGNTGTPPVLLGQSPEGNYIFKDSAWKKIERQPQMFLVINYAEHLPVRRQMMQAWAHYLDKLRLAKPEA
jgi:hypothetical protein